MRECEGMCVHNPIDVVTVALNITHYAMEIQCQILENMSGHISY